MSNELGSLWNEAVLVTFYILSQNWPGGIEENLGKDIQLRDLPNAKQLCQTFGLDVGVVVPIVVWVARKVVVAEFLTLSLKLG